MFHHRLEDPSTPLTPIPPMSHANFSFSPLAIARYFTTDKSLTPKVVKSKVISPQMNDMDLLTIHEESFTTGPPPVPTNTPTCIVPSNNNLKKDKSKSSKRRTFSPNIQVDNMLSPGLSPIADELNGKEFLSNSSLINVSQQKQQKALSVISKTECDQIIISNEFDEIIDTSTSMTKSNSSDEISENLSLSITSQKNQSISCLSFLNRTLSVDSILSTLGLSKYDKIFIKEEIDLAVLVTMTDDELQQIGIDEPNDRKLILGVISDIGI